MSVLLTDAKPPLQEVAKLGAKPSQLYGILWESALMDVSYDKRRDLPYECRRDTGGTTTWTIKGLADYVGSCRKTITKSLEKLLDAGFIQAENFIPASYGNNRTIFRVVHPQMLEAVRYANDIIGTPPSHRWHHRLSNKVYSGELWDNTEAPDSFYEMNSISYWENT
jgi:hypothetical protein